MKAEKLKLIAEKVYPNETIEIGSNEVWFMHGSLATPFNPLEETSQVIDIEEYFLNLTELISVENFRMSNMYTCYLRSYSKRSFSASRETRAEALCEAAFSFFQCYEGQ